MLRSLNVRNRSRKAGPSISVWVMLPLLMLAVGLFLGSSALSPALAQSVDVVIIGGATLDLTDPCSSSGTAANVMGWTFGGCLPVVGPAGELGDFNFAAMAPAAVSAASLDPYDTAVLNMASQGMQCNSSILSAAQQADIIAWVGSGRKLIIYDSECSTGVDYSWLPFSFETANPGATGTTGGTLTIVEDNTLSSPDPVSPYYINTADVAASTDAVGDMNVMVTLDANWCIDMSGTNVLAITGPVQTYAKYPTGTDVGLILYNGLDMDFLSFAPNANLREIWVQQLQQPFDPSNLPCGFTVVGITLDPETAENNVGEDHTVTATLSDLLGEPQEGVEVSFEVTSGPNAGTTGTCSPADCTSDAAGQVSFTYTGDGGVGTDEIIASFINQQGEEVFSQPVIKDWVEGEEPCPECPLCPECPDPFDLDEWRSRINDYRQQLYDFRDQLRSRFGR